MINTNDENGPAYTWDPKKGIVPVEAPVAPSGGGSGGSGGYKHPPGYHLGPGGFWVNDQGAVDPNDPAVAAALAKANPTGSTSLGNYPGSGGGPPVGGDWGSFLGIYNLPPDVQNKINEIFANTPDVTQATQIAMAYVRGTAWYGQTYPGINEGIARGIIGNEADYRAYVNGAGQLFKRYYGRDPSGNDILSAMQQGLSIPTLEKTFMGDAWVTANKSDVQYTLGAFGDTGQANTTDLKALGEENAGLDSTKGQVIQAAYQKALTRLHGAFQGALSNPNLSLGSNGLSAPSLSGQNVQPDTGA